MYNILIVEKFFEMCSFSESTAIKLAMSCPEEFVNHNKKFLSRIYPNGMRVDSSNYNPQDLWNCGCQMGRSTTFQIEPAWRQNFLCLCSEMARL